MRMLRFYCEYLEYCPSGQMIYSQNRNWMTQTYGFSLNDIEFKYLITNRKIYAEYEE